jgi:hypothetical protein
MLSGCQPAVFSNPTDTSAQRIHKMLQTSDRRNKLVGEKPYATQANFYLHSILCQKLKITQIISTSQPVSF